MPPIAHLNPMFLVALSAVIKVWSPVIRATAPQSTICNFTRFSPSLKFRAGKFYDAVNIDRCFDRGTVSDVIVPEYRRHSRNFCQCQQ